MTYLWAYIKTNNPLSAVRRTGYILEMECEKMNNKLLFPDFENIIIAGEIPTAIENGYTYLEQVMALRKYVLSLGEYTKDLTTNVNNNTDDITKLKAFKHITHLGTKEGDIFKLEESKDDLYYADYNIFI